MVAGLAMLVLALGAVLMVALGASGARGQAKGLSGESGYPGANRRLDGQVRTSPHPEIDTVPTGKS